MMNRILRSGSVMFLLLWTGAANAQFLLSTSNASMTLDGAEDLAVYESSRNLSSGDINGDGLAEDLEGIPVGSPASVFPMGMVFITRDPAALVDPMLVFTPLAHAEFSFGESVCARGDVDGDGFNDIAVRAPGDGAGSVFRTRWRSHFRGVLHKL